MNNKDLIIEYTYEAPIKRVWEAITNKDQMKQWYFDLDQFKPEVGFHFKFTGQGHKGERYVHLCTITEVVPLKKLQYSWEYEDYPGRSLVTIELFDMGDKTKLKLSHSGLETFLQNNEDFARKSFNEGWNEIFGKGLLDYLMKQ
jgi:uncharacterized protein YndB with AHSA1/START domain